MKLKFIIYTLFLITFLTAQSQHRFICNYNSAIDNTGCDINKLNFATDNQVIKAVDQILKPLGLPAHFILLECPNMSNALAITGNDGKRYILYDKEFMQAIAENSSDWAKISILAHEIGHHLSGHTLKDFEGLANQRQQELEADEFSGFILNKLGATLTQAQQGIKLLCTNADDTYKSHPNLNKRLIAIANGYNNAAYSKDNIVVINAKNVNSAEDYFYKGNIAIKNKDFNLAIFEYNKAIIIDPNMEKAFNNRGYAKCALGNLEGAIADYNKAISIDPKLTVAYGNRGEANYFLKNYNAAVADFKKASDVGTYDPIDFRNKGLEFESNENVVSDQTKANVTYPDDADAFYNRGNAKFAIDNKLGAISDYTQAISLNPNYAIAYWARGITKHILGNKEGALLDLKKSCELNYEEGCKSYQLFKNR